MLGSTRSWIDSDFPGQLPFPVAVKVNVTGVIYPFSSSSGPGVYIGFTRFALLKNPSPEVVHEYSVVPNTCAPNT